MQDTFPADSSLRPVPGKTGRGPALIRTHGCEVLAFAVAFVSTLLTILSGVGHPGPDLEDATDWNEVAEEYLAQDRMPEVFDAYEKAISIDPDNWVAFYNLGNALLLSREEAGEYYGLNEQELFDRAFALYEQALMLAPYSFSLAFDVAQSYYLLKPHRPEQALEAWHHAIELALTDGDRAECYLNLARTQINAGHHGAALNTLSQVKNPASAEIKGKLIRRVLLEGDGHVGSNHREACLGVQLEPPAASDPTGLAQTPRSATL